MFYLLIFISQLKEYGIDEEKLIKLLVENDIGKPFKWTQKLCGLEFIALPPQQQQELKNIPTTSNDDGNRNLNLSSSQISYELSQDSVISIIKSIKSRFQSRLGLFKQIYALENKNIDIVPNSIKKCDDNSKNNELMDILDIPLRISSNLVQWTSITWDEYTSYTITQRFLNDDANTNADANNFQLINCNDMFYRAIITRGSAKLECLINISSNFPINTPIWALNLSWNGKHDALNNPAIRVSTQFKKMKNNGLCCVIFIKFCI